MSFSRLLSPASRCGLGVGAILPCSSRTNTCYSSRTTLSCPVLSCSAFPCPAFLPFVATAEPRLPALPSASSASTPWFPSRESPARPHPIRSLARYSGCQSTVVCKGSSVLELVLPPFYGQIRQLREPTMRTPFLGGSPSFLLPLGTEEPNAASARVVRASSRPSTLRRASPPCRQSHPSAGAASLLLPLLRGPPFLLIRPRQHLARLGKLHDIDDLFADHDGAGRDRDDERPRGALDRADAGSREVQD